MQSLASKMAGKLAGKVALIAGGAGTVGSGIVRGFLRAGAKVVVPSRRAEALSSLKEEMGNPPELLTIETEVSTEAGMAKVLEFIDKELGGQLDHVVTSLGGLITGNILDQDKPEDFLLTAVRDLCGSHYVVARSTLQRIADRQGASYLFITGGLGGGYLPNYSFVTVGAAALWGLSIATRSEMAGRAARVNELRITVVIRRATSIANGIGDLVASVAAGSTGGEVITMGGEEELPGLQAKYGA